VQHLIKVHPYVTTFLEQLEVAGKQRVLVTNAHQKSLALKLKNTPLANLLDTVISAHQLGLPKENPDFWLNLSQQHHYNPQTTLLIDDNLHALESAQNYGIQHLLAIYQPDSQSGIKQVKHFQAIHSFKEILPE